MRHRFASRRGRTKLRSSNLRLGKAFTINDRPCCRCLRPRTMPWDEVTLRGHMTSEPDSNQAGGRRPSNWRRPKSRPPPLSRQPAAAESPDTRAAEEEPASSNASSPTGANQQTSSASSGRLKSHVIRRADRRGHNGGCSGCLWLTDLIPARDGTAGHTLASNTSAPATPSAPRRRQIRRKVRRPISARGSTRSNVQSKRSVPNRRSATASVASKPKRNRSATASPR